MEKTQEVIGWIAFYNGKKLEILKSETVNSLYSAKLYAIEQLRVPKSKQGLLAIEPGYTS